MLFRRVLQMALSFLFAVTACHAAERSLMEAVQAAIPLNQWRISTPGEAVAGNPGEVAFDDSAWQAKKLPWDWTGGTLGNDINNPPPAYADASNWGGARTGLRALWFRTSFDLPAGLTGQPVILSLGCIGDQDVTFVNGQKVGATDSPFADRNYWVDAKLLKEKGNVVAVYVRHEAPAVQHAHYHYFWGHSQMGWAFPGGIWERTPTIRPVSRVDAPTPESGKLLMPTDLSDPADGKFSPGKELTIDLISSTGRFFQNEGVDANLKVHLEKTVLLAEGKVPQTLRVTVLDLGGKAIGSQQWPVTFQGEVAEFPVTVKLPGPGWFRLQTEPLREGKPVEFAPDALGGRRAVNWANLLPHKSGIMEDSMFGVCHPDNVDERTFHAMNAVGARWLRWDVIWDRWNPAKGQYNFETPSVADPIRLCKQFQIQPLPLFTYGAQWAAHPEVLESGRRWLFSPPANPQDYYEATKAFAQHFKADLRYYEIWNEPMLGYFLFGVEGKSSEEIYNTRVFKPAAQAIQDVDPNIMVIYASQWAEPLANAKRNPQLQGLFQGAGIHPYSSDEPEIGRFGGISTHSVGTAGKSGGEWKDGYMTPVVGGALQVWNTETGWFPSTGTDADKTMKEPLNRRHIAAFIPRGYVTSVFRGIRKTFHFSLGDHMFANSCQQPHQSAVAYSTTSHFLEETKPIAFVPLRLAVPLYVFQSDADPKQFIAVTWSRGQDYWCKLPEGVKATDLQGRAAKTADGLVFLNQEALFLTLQVDSANADEARRTFSKLQPFAVGSTGAMDLWMTQGEAADWAKAIAQPMDGDPKE